VKFIKLTLTELQLKLILLQQINCGGGGNDDWVRVSTKHNYSFLQYIVAYMSLIPHPQSSAFIITIISEI
jgi:hypothetical protein